MVSLEPGLLAGGAPVMWERVFNDALPAMKALVPAGSHVLEIGYGNGLLSCYLCNELGWTITGLDICSHSHAVATENACRFGLSDVASFQCCSPEQTRQHSGQYDAVFIKTVLYSSPDLEEYGRWLDWILSVLKPGGVLINFESARANRLVQLYRRLRRRSYTSLCLYTPEVEALYDARFEIVDRRYYGGLSQFTAPISCLYAMVARLEEALKKRDAGNCFAVSIIGKRP